MVKKKPTKRAGRPKKSPEATKRRYLQVRVQDVERATFAAAADLTGLDVSAWVRTTLRAAARKTLKDHGESVPFLEK